MIRPAACIAFVILAFHLQAQEFPYQFSAQVFEALSKDSLSWKYQKAAWELASCGNYSEMLAVWDSGYYKAPSISSGDSAWFRSFHATDARRYILERARRERIIMINEAHHQPMHRVFSASLLPGLYEAGYRYFLAESLDTKDSLLNERKYPVIRSGYYLKEPQYGNLVRTALKLGYRAVAYDNAPGMDEREKSAAKKIKAILDHDPEAKIIIHCGFDHILENDHPNSMWEKALAGWIRYYTGIDPFTLDQVKLTEAGSKPYTNPYLDLAGISYYAVFENSSGELFNGQKGLNHYDARIYHPRTKWVNGRPHWVFENGRKPYFIREKITVGFPCLVLAYFANEDPDTAVPADIIELTNDGQKALALSDGEFILVLRDATNRQQRIRIKTTD